MSYNWKTVSPGGCDTHNVEHPCGKCAFPNIRSCMPQMIEALILVEPLLKAYNESVWLEAQAKVKAALDKARGQS